MSILYIQSISSSLQVVFQGHHKEGCGEAAAGAGEQTRLLSYQGKWNIKRYGNHSSPERQRQVHQHLSFSVQGMELLVTLFHLIFFPQEAIHCPSETWTPRGQIQSNTIRSGWWITAATTSLLKSLSVISAAWSNTTTVSTALECRNESCKQYVGIVSQTAIQLYIALILTDVYAHLLIT